LLTTYLKLSGSVKILLIPANELHLEKKHFDWRVTQYDEASITLQFDFENPEYVSVNEIDSLKISFFNTHISLAPLNAGLSNIGEGYTVVVKIPP